MITNIQSIAGTRVTAQWEDVLREDVYRLVINFSESQMVANSSFKLASVVKWISSESYFSPLIPMRSKVAVASEIKYVSYPKFPAILVVVETQ